MMSRETAPRMRLLLRGLILACAVCVAPAAQAAPQQSTAHVYVLNGLFNISPGLEELAGKIRRNGIPTTVDSHSRWRALAAEAIAQYRSGRLRSIAIIGHSMGGAAALDMAAELGRTGIPVDLVAAIDPFQPPTVPANVRRTVNFYVPGGIGSAVHGAADSRGAIQNLQDGHASHWSIIAAHEQQVLAYVLAATRSRPPAATATQGGAAPRGPAN